WRGDGSAAVVGWGGDMVAVVVDSGEGVDMMVVVGHGGGCGGAWRQWVVVHGDSGWWCRLWVDKKGGEVAARGDVAVTVVRVKMMVV
nr:hypothetical protein [Tanacetum cinerariifolium]